MWVYGETAMTQQAYSDIVFRCHTKLYVSGDLIQIATNNERSPAIFVQPDHRGAFLLSFNEISVQEVVPLTAQDLRKWLRRCREGDSAQVIRKCIDTLETTTRMRKVLARRKGAADVSEKDSAKSRRTAGDLLDATR